MKLAFFDDFKLGVVKGDNVVDVSSAVSGVPHTSPHDLINRVIEGFDGHRAGIEAIVNAEAGSPLSSVQLRPPLPKPYTIVCMAVNYMEDGTRDEPAPINAFLKSPHCVVGPNDTVVLPDIPATIFEFEAEMAFVIGKRAEFVKQEDAYDYIFGYLNFIDGSARGVLPPGNTFYQMKSRATFCPIGPYIVTADEFTDPLNRQVVLKVNGEVKQNYNTDDMAHKIPRIMEWVTSIHPLEPGDIVATGTNHRGLSALMDGDVLDLECEGLGNLHLNFKDDLKRTWARETRLDRQSQGHDTTTPQLTGKYA
ncbi:MAG: fumarylacetoacetate hydrolase family protein [Chloroflexi bacterium]|nr:fumarylacetoacetate hydrolase family protein [Chloroflexota bacterium]